MASKMLIVHGYSDGSTSFTGLKTFFVEHGGYAEEDVYLLDYSSMDDDATFVDFADKLETDYQRLFKGERIDVAVHSTGALVVRSWLALRRERLYLRSGRDKTKHFDCPVHRFLMFAPANFGSDLATMGQSFLGKMRSTFFNSNSHSEDFLESGKRVLQGLEPASPFQWWLSGYDLHGNHGSYFDKRKSIPERARCYPFVLAASKGYGGIQGKLLKKRSMAGTDGTVRICGSSLNTDYVTIDFQPRSARKHEPIVVWDKKNPGTTNKYDEIPFAAFEGFNHGGIINPADKKFLAAKGPGTLALEALKVEKYADYLKMVGRFREVNAKNYRAMKGKSADQYQQFFFRVRDDVDSPVTDFFIDFYVIDPDGTLDKGLTAEFDKAFNSHFYTHSADAACRVMMINCSAIGDFDKKLHKKKARLVFDVTAPGPLPTVHYQKMHFVVHDSTKPQADGAHALFRPNTTLLVDVVLNREATDTLLRINTPTGTKKAKTGNADAPAVTGRGAVAEDTSR